MRITLRVKSEGSVSGPLDFEQENITIGRNPDADVALPEGDVSVSRRHAELQWHGDLWQLRDLNSTHGTYLNGRRITQAIVSNGDTVKLGEAGPSIGIAWSAKSRDSRGDHRESPNTPAGAIVGLPAPRRNFGWVAPAAIVATLLVFLVWQSSPTSNTSPSPTSGTATSTPSSADSATPATPKGTGTDGASQPQTPERTSRDRAHQPQSDDSTTATPPPEGSQLPTPQARPAQAPPLNLQRVEQLALDHVGDYTREQLPVGAGKHRYVLARSPNQSIMYEYHGLNGDVILFTISAFSSAGDAERAYWEHDGSPDCYDCKFIFRARPVIDSSGVVVGLKLATRPEDKTFDTMIVWTYRALLFEAQVGDVQRFVFKYPYYSTNE